MRTGIKFDVSPPDRLRLERVVRDWNTPQKHAWRVAIILLFADGAGTAAIMRQTAYSDRTGHLFQYQTGHFACCVTCGLVGKAANANCIVKS